MKTYAIKSLPASRKAYDGFLWPDTAGVTVTCDDWNPAPICGGGLHAFKDGCGGGSLAHWDADAIWYLLSADTDAIIHIDNQKCKAPAWTIEAIGSHGEIVSALEARAPHTQHLPIMGATRTSGDKGQSTSGYYGQSTSGDKGQSTSGDYGQSTSGYYGQSTSGDYGQSTSGDEGLSVARSGRVRGGMGALLVIQYYSDDTWHWLTGVVDGATLMPSTWYKEQDGRFVLDEKVEL